MPKDRPQLSITLPRNFTFHYTEEPKTPEREVPLSAPRSPRAEGAYRIKRRPRPTLTTAFGSSSGRRPFSSDVPIPTIEIPDSQESIRPPIQPQDPGPPEGSLAPVIRKYTTLPRTPIARQPHLVHDWDSHKNIGDSISRPMSACSLMSDSSDDIDSLTSYPAGDGSCTSPESDAPDPFSRFASIKRGKAKQWASLLRNEETIQDGLSTKQTHRVKWTTDMDKHLWATYLVYLQDPTVTPFKMLPGTSPPLGVCHRVARNARRSWRGVKVTAPKKRKASELQSPLALKEASGLGIVGQDLTGRPGSPDTIKPTRSGSNTPTESAPTISTLLKAPLWPKSGSSTRRRLRYLVKSKPTIAPHYQRLLQSRSPSPFSSSSRTQSRSQSRLSEVTSPYQQPSSFNTRDIQLSLTTSTAASMQPDGPLSQLSHGADLPSSQAENRDWFNEPPVPFASEPVIPSDVVNEQDSQHLPAPQSTGSPRLGSPVSFSAYHTWGPSRTKQRSRPSTSRIQSSDAMTVGPSLRSPVRLHETFPYQGVHKRRALHNLEDELSPGGSSTQQSLLDNVFDSPVQGRHRRVRSRGFSLGDVINPASNPLVAMFTPPDSDDSQIMGDAPPTPVCSRPVSQGDPVTPTPQIRRLASPFEGIAPRATRVRGPSRHLATTSLGSHDSNFLSIGETLGQITANANAMNQTPQ